MPWLNSALFQTGVPQHCCSPGERELHSFHQALRNLPGFHCQCREQCHCCVRLHNVAISSKVHQYYPEQHSHSLSTPSPFWDIELDGVVPEGGTSGHCETTGVQELWILQSSSYHFTKWWIQPVPILVTVEKGSSSSLFLAWLLMKAGLTHYSVCHWITFESS